MDFTIKQYTQLLKALRSAGFFFQTFEEHLKAPKKKLYWFEKSGHGPLEEEPKKFNEVMIGILEELK